ncbi:4-aminobutyrate--2-oxoglutarate transaminase [Halovulum dunhuangense]|uniref:4-aminobutyrate--2-oxoglutarate transaminase n=1 Tax=Halovulum dunhuangense TaxID=1505036 RepID=A0A849L3Z0_9RHOB|nr:4-aminobutyrate--2-oxoglutarate transaminase [Halovulum dunhuangense]NNU80877.1 4-aminobutyrate--2-oxoglutarate transaminase [Halovulum dunhuangense]
MTSNHDLLDRRHRAVPRGVATASPVFVDRAQNGEIWDIEGRRYIDFASGIAVTNTGHRHPKVMAAAAAQMDRFAHVAFQVTGYEGYVALAERLNALAPIADARSVFFTTGAEATENAVKIARAHTRRSGVIAFTGAFHGRTQLTTAMTGKAVPYRTPGMPAAAGIAHVPFPIPHHGVTEEDSLRALAHVFKADMDPSEVAAIVIEPVQGEGGFYQAPLSFMQRLREICTAHGICLVADEVQTGFARTGRVFAIEHYGIEPDLIPIAKALGGGFPISGVIGRAEVMDSVAPGGLGGTYGGNPISCAAALAVLDVIEEEGLCARADAIGQTMVQRLHQFRQSNSLRPIGDVRGLGAMVAFELVRERGGHEPDPDATKAVTAAALDAGLILLSCGYYANTIRLLAPLTIADAHLHEGLDMLEEALKDKGMKAAQ